MVYLLQLVMIQQQLLFKDQLDMDKEGYLLTDLNQILKTETNVPGVYAAGDVKDKTFRQARYSCGNGLYG